MQIKIKSSLYKVQEKKHIKHEIGEKRMQSLKYTNIQKYGGVIRTRILHSNQPQA